MMTQEKKAPVNALQALRHFFAMESASGLCLIGATILALIVDNSSLSHSYHAVLHYPISIFGLISLPVEGWINDLLMAVFFFLVGLELKRESYEGALADRSQIVLPAVAALGGMVMPALIYAAFNINEDNALRGWAIPCATDIAFSLGILSLFGRGVPTALKVFLTALAIFDDLGAIVIIALFYSGALQLTFLAAAAVLIGVLYLLNHRRITHVAPYLLVGLLLWLVVLQSGIHATLAGVITALFIPMRHHAKTEVSPLRNIEHAIHPWVAFLVLPVFAFANAGVRIADLNVDALMHPVTLGIALGLIVGKQLGVFLPAALLIKFGVVKMPEGGRMGSLYGISLLTGIGFTMSLFIGGLAFTGGASINEVKMGVLSGSFVAAVLGALVLTYLSAKEGTKHANAL